MILDVEGIFAQQSIVTATGPVFVSLTETGFATDTTDHNVAMPASVAAGDLILLLWSNDSNDIPTPTGTWTEIYGRMGGSSAFGALWAKIAVGNEGGTTVDVTTPTVEAAAAQVIVFSDWSGNLADVQAATSSIIVTSQTFDCPSLTPSYGAYPSYWLATLHGSTGQVITSGPADYTDVVWTRGDPTSTGGQVGSARRGVLTVSSEYPGVFTMDLSTTADFLTGTVAIKGA